MNLFVLLDPYQYQHMPIAGTIRTNFDNSVWQPQFTAGVLPPPSVVQLANNLADAGLNAYGKQVRKNSAPSGCTLGVVNPNSNWGFESKDDDCLLELNIYAQLTLFCIACVKHGAEVKIYVAMYFESILHALGLYLNPDNTQAAVSRVVVGHEHFHNIQWVITEHSPPWDTYYEGQARFIQTILDPETEHDSTSFYYATVLAPYSGDGVNHFRSIPPRTFTFNSRATPATGATCSGRTEASTSSATSSTRSSTNAPTIAAWASRTL